MILCISFARFDLSAQPGIIFLRKGDGRFMGREIVKQVESKSRNKSGDVGDSMLPIVVWNADCTYRYLMRRSRFANIDRLEENCQVKILCKFSILKFSNSERI